MTTLPPATGTTIGGVIVGSGVNVAPDGTISVTHFSGDYNDLTNKPVIKAPVQSDWLATGGDAFIVNKPNFLSQFTNDLKVSAFPNDALYVDAAAAAAAAPIQSIAAGANVAISDDGHGNIVIAATGGGGGTPGGGVVSVSGTAPIKVVDGLNAPVISLVIGAGLKVNSGTLEADFSGLATVATSGSYNDLSDKPTIPPAYTLPTASGTVLGGVKVGTGLTMTGEVLSATGTTVPDASTSTKGIIQIADSAAITAGTASRAVDAAGLKAVTDQQAKDYVNVSGDTMTGSLAGIAGSATVQSFSVGKSGTGIHGSAAYDRLFVATKGERRVMVNEAGEISLGNWGANAASIGSGVRLAPERTGTGTVRGVAFATQFDGAAADAQNVFIGGSIAAGTKHYTAMRFPQPSGATSEDTVGIFFESLSGSIASACIESHANAGTGAWFINSTGTLPSYHSGQIQSGLGTASAPSLAYYNDTDTGTWSPAANTWAVSTGGVERLRVANTIATFTVPFAVNCSTASWAYATSTSPTAYMKLKAAGSSDYWFGVNGADDEFAILSGSGASQKLFTVGQDGHITAEKGTGGFLAHSGTAALPTFSFIGDADTGTFSPGANQWAVSCGGTERLRADNFGIDVKAPAASNSITRIRMRGADNKDYLGFYAYTDGYTAGKPLGMSAPCSYIAPVNGQLGIAAPTEIRFGIGSATEMKLDANGVIFTKPGTFGGSGSTSASHPAINFAGSSTSGLYAPAANVIGISTSGTERLRVKSTGGVMYAPLPAAPATPEEGEVYFDSTTKKLRVYDGTAWADLH
jgi:hypothetical protein